MARVTVAEVREILPLGVQLEDTTIQVHITAAMCLVDKVADLGSFTAECLKEMERYLAAHFCALSDYSLSLQSETDPCCDTKSVYGFNFGTGLMGTPFGQAANSMSCGLLEQAVKGRGVRIAALGSSRSRMGAYH